MGFEWDDNIRTGFRRETVMARHDLHMRDSFTDDGLADVLDRYPRERLGIFSFPPHSEGRVKARHGRAPDLSGADLVEAVRTGAIWLNLRAASHHLPEFADMAGEIFGSLSAATGQKVLKPDVGVLISSPGIHVHYHLDIPVVTLVQIRGDKTLHLYPAREPFASDSQIESIVLRENEEEVDFCDNFEAAATQVTLQPGMALTWPQNAPHRVQNGEMMNVSLSCEFMTLPALVRANALFANGLIRRRLGGTPKLPSRVGPSVVARAGLARAMKLFHKTPERGPTPISFELAADGTLRDIADDRPATR